MQPESFARWSPGARRKPADFTIRPGAERDVQACVRLVVALGAGRGRRLAANPDPDECAMASAVPCWWQMPTARSSAMAASVCVAANPQVAGAAPAGGYLLGLVVDQAWRRRGIGEALTRARMAWVAERSPRVYYFTGRGNLASQALHQRLGFTEMPGTWIPPGGHPDDAQSQQFYCAELHGDHPKGQE